MLVEQELCRKLVDILKDRLPDVEVDGNWLPEDDGGIKGTPDTEGSVLHVRVGMRGYTSFTDKVAEIGVELEGSIRSADDADGNSTFVCCSKILSLLSGWQDDIQAVKRDLSIDGHFNPYGYRLEPNGTLDIEEETLIRKYNQSFTLKGRISK